MAQIVLGPNRAYPALPTVGNDLESHSRALEAIVEALQIHERRTGDLLDSFVRVRELETLGLASIDGDVVTDGGQIGAGTGDTPSHTHDYLGSLVEDLSPQLGGDLEGLSKGQLLRLPQVAHVFCSCDFLSHYLLSSFTVL